MQFAIELLKHLVARPAVLGAIRARLVIKACVHDARIAYARMFVCA